MPFKSKAQLRTCYGKKPKGWNCDKFLQETPSVCCLPEKVGAQIKSTKAEPAKFTKSRCMRKGERIVGKVQTGARGGKYFLISENDNKGNICSMKVYVPKNTKILPKLQK
jgi:hypothetical protein